ncbi:MAG TPA: phosphate ABC transporter substrate-binding protein PstS, partial [Candidatus Binatia bacterium]|nr:phosphate ABC transporter substrate-binding protein PstS [Candidatus Binatia bacterium]
YYIPSNSRKLKFTGDNLAKIFLGEITQWNDARLVADNPQLKSVNQKIVVVHRKDGSGSTYGLTDFLSSVSKDWRDRVGVGTSVNWPVGVEAEGNGGVAKEVRANPYSLGYIELSYAITDKLAYAMVANRSGKFIDPTLESVTAAAASAEAPADLRFSIVNAPGERSYPIVTGTWLIVYKTQTDPAKAQAIARYLWWTTHDGQSINTTLNYAPVPREITVRSEELVKQINVGGKPALPR